jgi:excisionase family DNA binding protein
LELALEKARYEADRARRQYDAAEPENRLVAAELESRWEQALATVKDLEGRLRGHLAGREELDDAARMRLLTLGRDLKAAWDDEAAPAALKKRILRTVLVEIVADVAEAPAEVRLWLHWAGGVHTELRVPKNARGKHRHCTDQKAIDLIRELARVCADPAIAATLNKLGYRTGKGKRWIASRVAALRVRNGIPARSQDKARTWLTLEEAAAELGVAPTTVRRMIRREVLPATQVVTHAPWVIERAHLELPEVQEAARAARTAGRHRREP